MTTNRNCLQQALAAYKDTFTEAEIRDTHDRLESHKQKALDTGSVITTDLMKFSEDNIRNEERALKARQIQQIYEMQALIDNMQRINQFAKFGEGANFEADVKALTSKISGSQFQVKQARENTDTKVIRAKTTFLRQFLDDLDDDAATSFFSKEHQTDIANKLLKLNKNEDIGSDPISRVAKTINKWQSRLINAYRTLGIDISKLDSRISPNIHSQAKILKVDSSEREALNASKGNTYDFAKKRWINFTLPLLDKEKVFLSRDIDVKDIGRVNQFMGEAFDNIVNKGKVTQDRINLANRVKQQRVLHWKDGDSLISYNEKFGSGILQDSIIRELENGFGRIEVIKDWGISPITTIDRTFKMLEEDPRFKGRLNKTKNQATVSRLMQSLTTSAGGYSAKLGDISRSIRAWEYTTKLGMVTLTSLPDVAFVGEEAARLGMGTFDAIGETLSNFVVGMDAPEKEALSDLLNTARIHHLGSFSKLFETSYTADNIGGKGVALMHKLNLLQRWDDAQRGGAAALISRHFALNRGKTWETFSDSDRQIMEIYGFDKHDWNVIRQSAVKVANGKNMITPDSIQSVSDEVIAEALKGKGAGTINKLRIKQMKDRIEERMRDYIQDRQDHVILRPDVIDRDLLSFGVPPEKEYTRFALNLLTLFKTYSLAYIRKPLFSKLYAKGARNFQEALFSSKANWTGLAKLTTSIMGWSYVASSLKNLVLGLSPPSLKEPKTWTDMLQDSMGLAGMAFRIDPNDLAGSLGRSIGGVVLTDAGKVFKLGAAGLGQLSGDTPGDFTATKKATYGLLSNNIPLLKQAYTIKAFNELLLDNWQDSWSPGSRQKHLAQLEKKGVSQLF